MSAHRRIGRLGVTVMALASCFPLSAQAYADVLDEYRAYLSRSSLFKRTLGREKLAATRDPRALEVLVKSYGRAEAPKEQVRFLIASIAMAAFGRSADARLLTRWRNQHQKPIDAWLWFESLRKGPEMSDSALLALARGRGDVFVRGAALEALADSTSPFDLDESLALQMLDLLAGLPSKPIERAVWIESIGRVLYAKRRHVRTDAWKPVCRALIGTLDDRETDLRTKVVLSRQLAAIFKVLNLGFEPRHWEVELDKIARSRRSSGVTTTVTFFGVRAMGKRICYVIDASDSMMRRVTDREKQVLEPITGGARKPATAGGIVPTAADLDWNRIHTRFDCAREFLRVSLANLTEEHSFSVVLFGDHAETLAATKGLVPATTRALRKAISELNAIKGGPPTGRRPEGELRGMTNLHGGIRFAFRLVKGGVTKKSEYVDAKSMLSGCDTIFLLSDGAPSTDDWEVLDDADPEDNAGDQETGAQHQKTPQLRFYGPYAKPPFGYLVEDVERMNLFRKVEIHTVGFGEANDHLLRRIAQVGNGEAIRIEGERKGR